jgi:hypothetical protein
MQNIKYILLSLLLASGICFVACTERMDVDVNDAPPQLVIYGAITTDTAQHVITVRRSSNYFSNTQPEEISNATVVISDGDEVFTLSESPDEKGVYRTAPGVFGTEGKIYTLKVTVEFNGETDEYEAISLLPYAVRVDSVTFRQSGLAANIVDALLYGRLPESMNNYLNIVAYKNDTVSVNDKLSDFNIIESENPDGKEIDGAVCMNLRTEDRSNSDRVIIEPGDFVTVQVRSVTKEYADYVQDVQKELQGSIPIFSGPPANVRTNIRAAGNASNPTPVCGFFTAYSKTQGKTLYE